MNKVRVYRCNCFFKEAHWMIEDLSAAGDAVYFQWSTAMEEANKLARRRRKIQISSTYGKNEK